MCEQVSLQAKRGVRALSRAWPWAVSVMGLLAQGSVWAQNAGALPLVVGSGPSGTSYSVPIQTLLFFTALSFLPAILLMMTGFTRIVIVLSLLRQAFAALDILELRDYEAELDEGTGHRGRSALIGLVARRR